MSNEYSKAAVVQFLEYLSDKGLMHAATVSARKAAVNSFLGAFPDEETSDVRSLDLDELFKRFGNLKSSEFKPESMRVYKSRAGSAIRDFLRFKENPATFRPAFQPRNPSPRKAQKSDQNRSTSPGGTESAFVGPSDMIFPIPIRPNVVVQIAGIPSDLTEQEATKIANVVMALSVKSE